MDNKIIDSLFKAISKLAYFRKIGLHLVDIQPGYAVVEMAPREDNTNIFGTTHGGAIFSLIDEALNASCNSHGRMAMALNLTITYHQSPDIESTLRAESKELHRSRKTATYEIKVTDEKNALIASCQALAYRKRARLPFLDKE